MKYRLKIGFLLCLLTISLNVISQEKTNKLALTFDLFGNSGLYSVNGEYKIGKINNYQVNSRAGFGYSNINGMGFIGVPLGLNLLTGTKKHHLEFGLGTSYIQGTSLIFIKTGNYIGSEGIFFVPSIGYRFDKLSKGLVLKVYYSPLITVFDFFNKEKYLDEVIQRLNGSVTKEELLINPSFYSQYPTAKNNFRYFGVSIGYRF